MSELDQLLVRRIREGTVIDHILPGKAFNVLKTLNITGKEGNIVTVALNVPSSKKNKKDIIKVENKFLKNDDTDKIALISPHATINIIRNYQVAEKRKIQVPDSMSGIFKCTNINCISNEEKGIVPTIIVLDKINIVLKCKYCARLIDINEIEEI
ncbi:MAG TPA: aspartate carbamoyltransferase regulatory subunit [Nitrososphaeraceae archaeon]|jgi:aspartate carbamoyltransferase regulatory subunit